MIQTCKCENRIEPSFSDTQDLENCTTMHSSRNIGCWAPVNEGVNQERKRHGFSEQGDPTKKQKDSHNGDVKMLRTKRNPRITAMQ